MSKIRSVLATQSRAEEPERRDDERREAARSGGSSAREPAAVPVPPDSEVPARPARRRFTTAYKLAILRRADACTRHGELGALLRKEGLYSSHVITWRQQREAGLAPKKRGRKRRAVDPQLKKLEQENRRWTSRLQKAEALLAFQKAAGLGGCRATWWTRNSQCVYCRGTPGGVAVCFLVTSRTRKKTWSGGGLRT